MKKRGISAVVATVLIILIVVVGVGIIWKVILPLFAEMDYLSYSDVRLNIIFEGYTIYDPSENFAFVQIERGKDDVNVTGLEIGFLFNGTSKTYQTMAVPAPGGKYTYKFNFTNDSIFEIPNKVTVAPIFRRNNLLKLGKILDEGNMPSGTIILSLKEWEDANRDSAQNILVIHSGQGDEPGEEVEPVLPVDPIPPACIPDDEVCTNENDDDCDGKVDWDDEDCAKLGSFIEGDGSIYDPFIIYTCYQLQNMNLGLGSYYELARDIDCSMTSPHDDGFDSDGIWGDLKGFDPVGDISSFQGDFNGNNFKIIGLFINRPSEDNIGLFGFTEGGSRINNLGMVDSLIVGRNNVGGIAGSSAQSIISNTYNNGSVTGQTNVGGISGYAGHHASIVNSYNLGLIIGSQNTGGIAGSSSGVHNSYNNGAVYGSQNTGGIAGIVESYSSGISNTYNTGFVYGSQNTGGIAGYSSTPIMFPSYYLDSSCPPHSCIHPPISIVSLSDSQMRIMSSYSGWAEDIWGIDEGISYPYLIGNEQIPHPGI